MNIHYQSLVLCLLFAHLHASQAEQMCTIKTLSNKSSDSVVFELDDPQDYSNYISMPAKPNETIILNTPIRNEITIITGPIYAAIPLSKNAKQKRTEWKLTLEANKIVLRHGSRTFEFPRYPAVDIQVLSERDIKIYQALADISHHTPFAGGTSQEYIQSYMISQGIRNPQ